MWSAWACPGPVCPVSSAALVRTEVAGACPAEPELPVTLLASQSHGDQLGPATGPIPRTTSAPARVGLVTYTTAGVWGQLCHVPGGRPRWWYSCCSSFMGLVATSTASLRLTSIEVTN